MEGGARGKSLAGNWRTPEPGWGADSGKEQARSPKVVRSRGVGGQGGAVGFEDEDPELSSLTLKAHRFAAFANDSAGS